MKRNYMAVELCGVGVLTAVLLGFPDLGGARVVAPIVCVAWVALQLVSSVAFCDAIHKGKIVVFKRRGEKETYGVAKGAKLSWVVLRHIWAYELIREPKRPEGQAGLT